MDDGRWDWVDWALLAFVSAMIVTIFLVGIGQIR